MQLTEHFTLAEFTRSDKAGELGVDNSLPDSLLDEARRTCAMLEAIRAHLGGVPIILTSGYRCLDVNRAIGSADTSDHLKAHAADFRAPKFGSPYKVARELSRYVEELGIGQLIHEFGSWVHVSTRRPDKRLNRIITISARGTEVGVQEV